MKLSLLATLSALSIGVVIPRAHAVAFACEKATSVQEKQICQSPLLGQLDDELAVEWQKARKFLTAQTLSQPHEQALNQFQRSWLNTRDECQDEDCLRQRYQQQLSRLRYLNQLAQHALPTPIVPVKHNVCFHGTFHYDVYLQDLTQEEYDNLGSYFQDMYNQRVPYHAVSLSFAPEKTAVAGSIAIAFRYGNRLDDGDFNARQMSETQAIGRRESSFEGSTKILLTCFGDDQLRVTTFDSKGESYLFNMVMQRDKS